jgi:CRISPR/Cas system CSM-associated protein Csm2 small subunit
MTALEEFKLKIENKRFLDDEIMKRAEDIGKELKGVTTTKMRQYFDDIKGLRRIIDSGAEPDQIRVKLQLILSRIHYDAKRDKKLSNLKDFLCSLINKALKSTELLQATKECSIFFENFYGYFYFYAEKPKREEE